MRTQAPGVHRNDRFYDIYFVKIDECVSVMWSDLMIHIDWIYWSDEMATSSSSTRIMTVVVGIYYEWVSSRCAVACRSAFFILLIYQLFTKQNNRNVLFSIIIVSHFRFIHDANSSFRPSPLCLNQPNDQMCSLVVLLYCGIYLWPCKMSLHCHSRLRSFLLWML